MLSAFFAGPSHAAEIWLAGVDPFVKAAMKPGAPTDYMQLFQKDAPWRKAAQNVAVLKTSTQWIINAPEGQLRLMIADLHERHIAVGMEGLMIPRGETCGQGIEGYSAPGAIAKALQRIKDLDGELAFIAMDTPLSGGYRFKGAHACRSSMPDLAMQIAINVKAAKAVFPNIKIGDIETLRAGDAPDWIHEIAEWADVYRKVVGEPLAFFHADVDWANRGINNLQPLVAELHKRQIPFGVIYDGDPQDKTGEDWTHHAEERFEAVEGRLGLKVDQAVLQTWMDQPANMLPEDRPGTMTSLVLSYARPHTHLAAHFDGVRLSGRLTDDAGNGIAHATLTASVETNGQTGDPAPRELEGEVPAGALIAIFAMRLDTECDCHGEADIGLGALSFTSASTNISRRLAPVDEPPLIRPVGGSSPGYLTQYRANPEKPVSLNSPPFAVTPGQRFKFGVTLRASTGADESGYVSVIFLDQNRKELRRDKIAFAPADITLGNVQTSEDGSFSSALSRKLPKGLLQLTFPGSPTYRGTVLQVRG